MPAEIPTTNPCAPCEAAGFCVRDGACLDAAYGHGSPELDADAAKLEAIGADPGPTWQELFEVRIPCEVCQREGRILRISATRPDEEVDYGPCPECGGTCYVVVEAKPAALDDMQDV